MKIILSRSMSFFFIITFICALLPAFPASAQLPNAWQIDDHTNITGSFLSYTNLLNAGLRTAATNAGFDFSVNARFVGDYATGSQTMAMIYGDGKTRWEILWSLTNGDLVSELITNVNPVAGETFVVTANGTGASLYHTHEIVFNPANRLASYLVDGQVVTTNWAGSTDASFTAGQVEWGAASSTGVGVMNFHRVSFTVTNGDVAAYDADAEPANAPDPVTQGWHLPPSTPPVGTSTNAISPDAAPLPANAVATTLAATYLEPYQATLSGVVNAGGLAATTWFEWGTDTSYGNTTPPRFLAADTNAVNLAETLTGLAKEGTYHFRCVATNALGAAYGQDAMFTTPLEFTVTSLADSGPCSLRQSIADAQSGDTITFATNGTLTLTNQLYITNTLTITGPGPASLTVICQSGVNPVLYIVRDTAGVAVSISGLTIANSIGGGIFMGGSTLTVSNCILAGNGDRSGGIYNIGGTLTVNNCTLSGNSADRGGGIYCGSASTNTLNDCTLVGNSATLGGGGIYADMSPGHIVVRNCTISGNFDRLHGGGVYIQDAFANTDTLVNCTLVGNSAGIGGGIYQEQSSPGLLTLTNTIVAGNTATTNSPNIFGSAGSISLVNSLTSGDPLLAPLCNYGGPTQTMPPLAGSPAIDYGLDSVTGLLATDQRGYPRRSGTHVDIGAVEAQYAPANQPPHLTSSTFPAVNGASSFQFMFSNVTNADFTVLATTNLALSLTNWVEIGNAAQNPPGRYQFTDPGATNYPQRFYQVVSP